MRNIYLIYFSSDTFVGEVIPLSCFVVTIVLLKIRRQSFILAGAANLMY